MDEDDLDTLESATSFVASPDSEYIYLSGDRDLNVLQVDTDTGALTSVASKSVLERDRFFLSDWAASFVVRAAESSILWIIGRGSPHVAAYDLTTPEDPQHIHSISDYYRVSSSAPSLDRSSGYAYGCKAIGAHATMPAADFACANRMLTPYLDSSDEVVLTDHMVAGDADRFGRKLGGLGFNLAGLGRVGNRSSSNMFLMSKQPVGTLAVFDDATRITGDPYQ